MRGNPNPFNLPAGCNFSPRCPHAFGPCRANDIRIEEVDPSDVACWLYTRGPDGSEPPRLRPRLIEPSEVRA